MTQIAAGVLLALLTWIALGVTAIAWGLLPARVVHGRDSWPTLLRRSLWWGIALISVLLVGLGSWIPLSSAGLVWVVVAGALILGLLGLRRCRGNQSSSRGWGQWWLLIVALIGSQIVLAFAAVGPATNYDTGLYHLGAIAYGRDFAAIPGLANLYGPLGYSTIEFVWASALGSTPWGPESFRLVNGFLMAAVALDLALRLRGPRRVGTYVLLVGVVVTWGPMLGMADFWITSPTQDAAALMLSLIVIAYLSDAVAGKGRWLNDAIIACLVGVLLIAVRTTMAIFVIAAFAVVLLLIVRRGNSLGARIRTFAFAVIPFTLAMTLLMGIRDYFLSGWWNYPLSLVAFDVPWRAPDPTALREATLGYHRDPTDIPGALASSDWIGGWFSRLPTLWETYLLIGSVLLFIGLVVYARMTAVHLPSRRMALATAPSIVAVVVWFVASPPAFRFIWGPLFAVLVIPVGWIIAEVVHRQNRIATVISAISAAVIAVASLATVLVRIDWGAISTDRTWALGIAIPYRVAPVQNPAVTDVRLPSGLVILQPMETDQCWSVYPLCSPTSDSALTLRGDDLSHGFTTQ